MGKSVINKILDLNNNSTIQNSWILDEWYTRPQSDIIGPGSFKQQFHLGNYVSLFSINRTEQNVSYATDLPGVKKDTLDVSIFNGVLQVNCTRNGINISRTQVLSDDIDISSPDALLEDGVLTVTFSLKKSLKPQPQKIVIK